MITCCQTALRKYKARAGRRYPNEYMETLWGASAGKALNITHFQTIKHSGTPTSVGYEIPLDEHIDHVRELTGLEFLGTIHSHNGDYPGNPSEADNHSAREDGEKIFAIDHIIMSPSGRRRHTVNFWQPQHPIDNVLVK